MVREGVKVAFDCFLYFLSQVKKFKAVSTLLLRFLQNRFINLSMLTVCKSAMTEKREHLLHLFTPSLVHY